MILQTGYINPVADDLNILLQHAELLAVLNAGCIIFDDLSYSEPPPSQFHYWDETKTMWIEDEQAKHDYLVKANTAKK